MGRKTEAVGRLCDPLRCMVGTAAALLLAVTLAGCATGANARAMAPEPGANTGCPSHAALAGNVALGSVDGGEKTKGWDKSKVETEDLREALRLTLEERSLFNADAGAARFRLDAFLVELNQPNAGYTMEVVSFVRYKLAEANAAGALYDDVVKATYAMDVGDEFFGAKRLRLVNEGSIRTNISKFLSDLCALEIRDPAALR